MPIRFHRIALVVSCAFLSLALNGTALAQFKPSVNLAKDKPVDPSQEEKRKETDEKYRETLKTIPLHLKAHIPNSATAALPQLAGAHSAGLSNTIILETKT